MNRCNDMLSYSYSSKLSRPGTTRAARTMVADVAVAVPGCTPMDNMMGPFTMPPPTPNVPAIRPANW